MDLILDAPQGTRYLSEIMNGNLPKDCLFNKVTETTVKGSAAYRIDSKDPLMNCNTCTIAVWVPRKCHLQEVKYEHQS